MIWNADEINNIFGSCLTQAQNISGISIDTRTIKQGDLFVALHGDNSDGHAYAVKAIENGATAIMVDHEISGIAMDRQIIVPDTLKGLEKLAHAARNRSHAKIIGITGSVGKTGTKEMLRSALSDQGKTHASIKSYNNHWGVPLSVASMPADCDYGVFEMGMNHADEITPLSKIVRPDIAIITTIAAVHIEAFDDGLEGIARAKAEIFDGMEEGGIAILNRDLEQYDFLLSLAKDNKLRVISFGEHIQSDIRMTQCVEASNGTHSHACLMGQGGEFTLPIAGKHLAMNALAVLAAVHFSGADLDKAINSLQAQEYTTGRGARETINMGDPNNPVILIDESYNASPVAMKAAFKVLSLINPKRPGRRIAILGDMLELGKDSAQYHADLAAPLCAANVDVVYTCGQQMKNLYDALPANQRGKHADNSDQLAKIITESLIPGDVVMVKGSLGSKMSVIVEALRVKKNC